MIKKLPGHDRPYSLELECEFLEYRSEECQELLNTPKPETVQHVGITDTPPPITLVRTGGVGMDMILPLLFLGFSIFILFNL
jgi:hypothetical protein